MRFVEFLTDDSFDFSQSFNFKLLPSLNRDIPEVSFKLYYSTRLAEKRRKPETPFQTANKEGACEVLFI